jgi:SAM-dependent methyltransferase
MKPPHPTHRRAKQADTDADWEYFGANDPYWAVVTLDQFRRAKLDADARRKFFEIGEAQVAHVFEVIPTHLDPKFAPARALDFGCGVGRMVIPLAARCASVFGVDVSQSMLREARHNCDERGIRNVTLLPSDDDLSAIGERFDLVNTFIVLQHIPCGRGSRILARLVELLDQGGVGVIHVTHSTEGLGAHLENIDPGWPTPTPDGLRHHLSGLLRAAKRRLERNGSRQMSSRQRATSDQAKSMPVVSQTPSMQMNPYALNPLFHMLQTAGVRETYVEFTDHGGFFGVVLYFKKQAGAPYQL